MVCVVTLGAVSLVFAIGWLLLGSLWIALSLFLIFAMLLQKAVADIG